MTNQDHPAEPVGVSHDLCVCGKPAAHVNADPDEADWACRVPVVGVSDAPENPELSIPAGVCDEAVEAAREAYRASACALSANGAMRAALEAAAPLLGTRPQPTLDRETLKRQIIYSLQCSHLGSMPDEQIASHVLTGLDDTHRGWDAVRPLPTREQIAEALHHDNHVLGSARCKQYLNGQLTSCYERTMHDADAVLALMGGAE